MTHACRLHSLVTVA